MEKRSKSEIRLQQDCVMWANNKASQTRGLLNFNNNNSLDSRTGAFNKSMGIRKGRSDLVLYWDGMAHHIELKTLTGTQSTAQIEWQAVIEAQGFKYYIIRTLEEFKLLILNIIA